jgi:hypothetical protein
MNWNQNHANIISAICSRFNKEEIRYFILRNYEGLPDSNPSKDVDIIIEPKSLHKAKDILKEEYIKLNIEYYFEEKFTFVHCCHGMNLTNKFSIKIDLIGSYVSKGFELFTFDELYFYSENYKEFRVLNKFFEGVMVFIYKQFNYTPKLKKEYKQIIYNTYIKYPDFKTLIDKLIGENLSSQIFTEIDKQNFDKMLSHSSKLTIALRKYAFRKNPIKTTKLVIYFISERLTRMIFRYNKFSKVISVMGPDGAGKTTFLDSLKYLINFYFSSDEDDPRYTIYHFRPNLLPNLGVIGEKSGVRKQDIDFTNPHRAKPVNKFSSLIRITYYWLDYVLGYMFFVRLDSKYSRFSIFDRYSYDFLVDPTRTRLNLPMWLRKIYVKCMPQPKVGFYLDANPEVVYKRKQELTIDEITRQNKIYSDLASSNKRFYTLDSNRPPIESINDAIKILIENFTDKL